MFFICQHVCLANVLFVYMGCGFLPNSRNPASVQHTQCKSSKKYVSQNNTSLPVNVTGKIAKVLAAIRNTNYYN